MKRNTNVRRTIEEVTSWYEEHVSNNITLLELSKKYNTDAHYQFKKFGLKPLNLHNIRRINRHLLLNFFDNMNNEKDAYILGLFFSDGCISNNTFKISLHNSDEYLLENIRDYMMPTVKLHNDRKNKTILLCSEILVNNLISYGATNNKTYDDYSLFDIVRKAKIDTIFYKDFIRGYFDGDGTIYYDGPYLRFNICSITKQILLDIQHILKENDIVSVINTEIREGKIYKLPQGNSSNNCKNMHRLYVRQKESLKLLFNFLYRDNPSFYLKRKYDVFNKYVNIELT